jgi:hypothetical protein
MSDTANAMAPPASSQLPDAALAAIAKAHIATMAST